MSHIDELDIVIRNKGAKVSAGIPQLALWATASDAHEAINALERKRAAFLADLAEAGGLDDLEPRPYTVRSASPPRAELAQFTLKGLIIIGLIAGLFTLSGAWLASRVERVVATTKEYTKVGGAQFWEKMEHELDRAADPASDLPAEQKRKLLAQIHVIVERLRPFVAEIAPLFAEFQKSTPSAAPPNADGLAHNQEASLRFRFTLRTIRRPRCLASSATGMSCRLTSFFSVCTWNARRPL